MRLIGAFLFWSLFIHPSFAQLFETVKKSNDYAIVTNAVFDNRSNGFYVSYVDEILGKKGIDRYDENFQFIKRIVELDISSNTSLRLKTADEEGNLYIHDGFDIKVYDNEFNLVRSMTTQINESATNANGFSDIAIDPRKGRIRIALLVNDIYWEYFKLDGTFLERGQGPGGITGATKILYSNDIDIYRWGRSGYGTLYSSIGPVYNEAITDYALDNNNWVYIVKGDYYALLLQPSNDPNGPAFTKTNSEFFGENTHRITASHDGKRLIGISDETPAKLVLLKRNDLQNQSISWSSDFTLNCSDPDFAIDASSTSGLPLEYSSSDPAILSFSGNNGHIKNAGQVTITLTQPGNENFLPASISKNFTINAKSQSVDFPQISSGYYGDSPFDLQASSPSGNDIFFYSSDPSVAAVSGKKITIVGPGITEVQAEVAAGNCWNGASVKQLLCVAPSRPQLKLATNNQTSLVIENPAGQLWTWFRNGEIFKTTSLPYIDVQEQGSYSVVQTTKVSEYEPSCDSHRSNELAVPITVFPNPTEDNVQFYISEPIEIQILNSTGQVLNSPGAIIQAQPNGPNALVSIDLSILPRGIYYLKIRTANGSSEVKRVVRI